MENNISQFETSLLGLILVDEKVFHSVKGMLDPGDFHDPRNSIIFDAVSKVYERGFEDIELQPIVDELKREGKYTKIGGTKYLAQLMERPALKSNVTKYIKQISDASNLRKVKAKINKLQKDLEKDSKTSAEDILEKVEQDILEATRGTEVKGFIDAKTAINETIKKIDERATGKDVSGKSVGFPAVDNITGGFQNGDLIILAARPSMGKTALALNFAANVAKKHNVAFFSIEMPYQQLYNRIIGFTAFIDQNKLRDSKHLTESEWNKIHASKAKIEKLKLYVDETAGIKLSELVWKAKNLHKNGKLDMIVIDYLQLITVANSKGDNRQNEVSVISRTLKKLARDLNVPVIALSQLSRKVESRESKIPMMSDLRESGAIEQDADIVSFVYREAYYDKDKDASGKTNEITKIIFAKHRNGATGNVELYFKASNGLFVEKGY